MTFLVIYFTIKVEFFMMQKLVNDTILKNNPFHQFYSITMFVAVFTTLLVSQSIQTKGLHHKSPLRTCSYMQHKGVATGNPETLTPS